jgi:hypothetical protein
VFVCEDENSDEVRRRIDAALRYADGWVVATSQSCPLNAPERQLARRLGAASDGPHRDT